MKSLKVAMVSAVCLLLVAALPASAMTTAEEFTGLWNRCAEGIGEMIKSGYVIEHVEFDRLKLNEVYVSSEFLSAGYSFKIIGVGGAGIRDLDIRVYDENNNLVAKDTLNDDVPEVDIAPKWSGPFRVEVVVEALSPGCNPAEDWYFCYIIGSKPF